VATLWLIGMMGSGKSTVAPMVADALALPWCDTDAEVERRAGLSVDELFGGDADGFRRIEATVVGDLADEEMVVACGGGVVLDPETVQRMRSTGLVVWLDAPVPVLSGRVGNGHGRPLLGEDPETALETMMTDRRHLYDDAAHVAVDASQAMSAVADQVISVWTSR
jgi:shikimate kinase